MMFVHPDHQGRGVATAPPATVEAAARALDLAKIFTEASLTAWPFFEKRGQVLRGFRMRERLTAI